MIVIVDDFLTQEQCNFLMKFHEDNKSYWSKFLGVKVPVFTGSERIAKKYNLPVVYGRMKKLKRGYYSVEFQLITENPNDYDDYEITEKYLRLVENQLHEDPHPYLWTHNRFKHRKTN